jgi:hypothetical protein
MHYTQLHDVKAGVWCAMNSTRHIGLVSFWKNKFTKCTPHCDIFEHRKPFYALFLCKNNKKGKWTLRLQEWTHDEDDMNTVHSWCNASVRCLMNNLFDRREPKKTISKTFFIYGWRGKNLLLKVTHWINPVQHHTVLWWEKKTNPTAIQRYKRRGTQGTVNSKSGDGCATYRHSKEFVRWLWYRSGKIRPWIITTLAIPRYWNAF